MPSRENAPVAPPAKNYNLLGRDARLWGILALVLTVFPVIPLLGLVLGIVAIVKSGKVLEHEPLNDYAKTGRLLGWASVAIYVLYLIGIIVLIASGVAVLSFILSLF